jgi:hypothetical protein
MTISLTCSCGRKLSIKPEFAGRKIHCPSCRTVLRAPVLETEPPQDTAMEVDSPELVLAGVEAPAPTDHGAKRKPESRSRRKLQPPPFQVVITESGTVQIPPVSTAEMPISLLPAPPPTPVRLVPKPAGASPTPPRLSPMERWAMALATDAVATPSPPPQSRPAPKAPALPLTLILVVSLATVCTGLAILIANMPTAIFAWLYVVTFAVVGQMVSLARGRAATEGILLGTLLGPFGLIVAGQFPDRSRPAPPSPHPG